MPMSIVRRCSFACPPLYKLTVGILYSRVALVCVALPVFRFGFHGLSAFYIHLPSCAPITCIQMVLYQLPLSILVGLPERAGTIWPNTFPVQFRDWPLSTERGKLLLESAHWYLKNSRGQTKKPTFGISSSN